MKIEFTVDEIKILLEGLAAERQRLIQCIKATRDERQVIDLRINLATSRKITLKLENAKIGF